MPEWIGEGRNWDYRYTWIRDATLTLTSLVILGSLAEATAFKGWLERTAAGGELTASNGEFLTRAADLTVASWRRPDQGIWEIRDEPRHFVHAKLNCWVALDRAVQMARAGQRSGPVDRWAAERDLLADWLRSEGSPDGWFVQAGVAPLPLVALAASR